MYGSPSGKIHYCDCWNCICNPFDWLSFFHFDNVLKSQYLNVIRFNNNNNNRNNKHVREKKIYDIIFRYIWLRVHTMSSSQSLHPSGMDPYRSKWIYCWRPKREREIEKEKKKNGKRVLQHWINFLVPIRRTLMISTVICSCSKGQYHIINYGGNGLDTLTAFAYPIQFTSNNNKERKPNRLRWIGFDFVNLYTIWLLPDAVFNWANDVNIKFAIYR